MTVPLTGSGGYIAEVTLDLTEPTTFHLTGTWVQGTGRNSLIVRMYHNGNWVASEKPIEGTIGVLTAQVQAFGSTTFTIKADEYVGDMRCNILAMGVRR